MLRAIIQIEETTYANTQYETKYIINEVVRYKDANTLDKAIKDHMKRINKQGEAIRHIYNFIKIVEVNIPVCDRFAYNWAK